MDKETGIKTGITILDNQSGSVLVMGLLIMVVVTLIGTASTTESSIEANISRNFSDYKANFYRAEFAAKECLERMDSTPDKLADLQPDVTDINDGYLHNNTPDPGKDYERPYGFGEAPDESEMLAMTIAGQTANYGATFRGVAPQNSLDMTDLTRIYEYSVFSIGSSPSYVGGGRSQVGIQMGYYVRY